MRKSVIARLSREISAARQALPSDTSPVSPELQTDSSPAEPSRKPETSFGDDENILQLDSGDGCTTL